MSNWESIFSARNCNEIERKTLHAHSSKCFLRTSYTFHNKMSKIIIISNYTSRISFVHFQPEKWMFVEVEKLQSAKSNVNEWMKRKESNKKRVSMLFESRMRRTMNILIKYYRINTANGYSESTQFSKPTKYSFSFSVALSLSLILSFLLSRPLSFQSLLLFYSFIPSCLPHCSWFHCHSHSPSWERAPILFPIREFENDESLLAISSVFFLFFIFEQVHAKFSLTFIKGSLFV